jgi:pyridoxal phosphate enzyme (YggS family)
VSAHIHSSWDAIAPGVTVVGITKTFPFEAVATARVMGLRHIGENRVEEARGKIQEAQRQHYVDLIWHMVGHVQSRKAADVVQLFDWVDSVDTLPLAQRLDSLARQAGKKLHILLEVNLSGEKSKYGFDLYRWEEDALKKDQLVEVVASCMSFPNLIIEGFMTMAPYTTSPEENRPIFRSMKALSKTIRAQFPQFGSTLSMGTSGDYKIAVEEGATQIRLGEALFGSRPVAKKP